MKIFLILSLLLFLVPNNVYSQQKNSGVVRGRLVDSSTQQNLRDATVAIFNVKDSTLVLQRLSKEDGSFLIEGVTPGNYIFRVSYQGYKTYNKSLSITAQSLTQNFGTILLAALPKDLGVVVVTSTPPIVVKGDTTEFSSLRIKTKPNATAEDLLKKIPGMEVDKDGSVKAQGEQVTKILVDGKVFFSDDPKMATKNLPTDLIDKIQIIDAQSDQSVFSGFDDGNREKVINIITKKDRPKGYFGKGNFSRGSDGRYGTDVNISRFNGDRKISFIGNATNTNQENYSIQDILSVINNGGFGASHLQNFGNTGQSGVARTYAGGLNYNDVLSKKTVLNGSYRYNNVNTINQNSRTRETFITGDSSIFNNNNQYANNRNINHQFNFEVEHKFDSMNSVLLRPSYSTQRSNNYSESNSVLTRGKSISQKDVRTINNSLNDGSVFNNRILFRHRFAKRGRTLSVNLNQEFSNNYTDRTAFNYTNNYVNGTVNTDTTNRISDINRQTKNNSIRVSLTEAVGSKGRMELSYTYENNQNNSNQKTNTFNRLTGDYDIIDTILSNNFKNINTSQRAGFNYLRQVSKDLSYTAGLEVQHAELSSDNKTKLRSLSQTFRNFFPTATIQYKKNKKVNFRFYYRGSTRQPDVLQLQDVVDNTNLLNITRGNPALKQEFTNNFNFRFTKVNSAKSTNFIIRLNGVVTSNKISNAISINTSATKMFVDNVELEPLARYSKPVNLNGSYFFKGYVNYGFPLKSLNSNVNLSTDLSHSRDVNLVNNVNSFTRNYIVSERVRLAMNIRERFDINFSSSSTYNIARYGISSQQNRNYFTQIFSVEPTYNTKSGWMIAGDFDYSKTMGQAAGFNQSIPLLNASLSKLLFKKKQGELKLSVFDLLNQNKSITRNIEENFIEDVRTNVLQRYFLLTFSYNLRVFGI